MMGDADFLKLKLKTRMSALQVTVSEHGVYWT